MINLGRKISGLRNGILRLSEVIRRGLVHLPPYAPLANEDVASRFDALYDDSHRVYSNEDFRQIPLFFESYMYLYYVIKRLYNYVQTLFELCDEARKHKLPPHPGCMHTIDSFISNVAEDIDRVRDHVVLAMHPEDLARSKIAYVLTWKGYKHDVPKIREDWKIFSKYCMLAVGTACTTITDISNVTIRRLLFEMDDAIWKLADKLVELYGDVVGGKVGLARPIHFYKSPKSPPELVELAEYSGAVLLALVEKWNVVPLYLATYALKDAVAVKLGLSTEANAFIKPGEPGWNIEVYIGTHIEYVPVIVSALERVLKERGFRVTRTDYGLKLTASPRDVKEAIKIVNTIPALDVIVFKPDTEHAYNTILRIVEAIEWVLQEKKYFKEYFKRL